MILAGDIGGTKTRLALFRQSGGGLSPVLEQTFRSPEYTGLEAIVSAFVASQAPQLRGACFGIAGPVRDGRCETTNLPWVVDACSLAALLRLETVVLINDLEANACGIGLLQPDDLLVLQEGSAGPRGNAAIIAAGTGLGEAGLFWNGSTCGPFACEGGHADFAPRNDLEIDLLRNLLKRFRHVSWERVLSGPGLHNLYLFLRDTGRGEEPRWLAEEMERETPPTAISRAALEGRSTLCSQALDLFVSLYGAEAGNLGLKMMAVGGVYVGGGIAPKIVARLRGAGFIEAFNDKGRMRPLLESMPVRVILNDRTALLGAARRATLRPSSVSGEPLPW